MNKKLILKNDKEENAYFIQRVKNWGSPIKIDQQRVSSCGLKRIIYTRGSDDALSLIEVFAIWAGMLY